MANALYDTYKQLILGAGLDLTSLNIKVALVDTAEYTFSAAHDFLNDVEAGSPSAVIARSGNFATKTVTNGVFDADPSTFTAVVGAVCEALVIYRDTGTDSTSNLIAYIDTGVTGLPVTPNGGDITVTWDDGANKIFAL